MRPVEISLAANGNSAWAAQDYYQTPPAITLAGSISSGASLTWTVQGTADDPSGPTETREVTISQAGTVITVTDVGPASRLGTHGLSVGDYVNILGTSQNGVKGEYSVATVVSTTQYTVTSLVNQNITLLAAKVITARVFNHPALLNQTVRSQGQWAFPVRASRLQVTNYVSGVVSLVVLQGGSPS